MGMMIKVSCYMGHDDEGVHFIHGVTYMYMCTYFLNIVYRELHKQVKQKDGVCDRTEHQHQKQPQTKIKVGQSVVAWEPVQKQLVVLLAWGLYVSCVQLHVPPAGEDGTA